MSNDTQSPSSAPFKPSITSKSEPISWVVAQTLINAYQSHPQRLQNDNGQTIKGFSVDAQDLMNIINGVNEQGNQVQGPSQKVMIIMAVNPSDINKPSNEQAFTTILAGSDASNNLLTGVVYEYCEPCPPACKNNFF